jgi:ABC-2 type transport system permease protein
MFPDALRTAVRVLPFVAMLEYPMDVFLEHAQGADLVRTLSAQAAWAAVLLLAGRAMLTAGWRKLVVQGG